ncbi:unnamed protein product [Paramecium pentaurelia]|uniref:Uncharacterized protein n=1 Tax=Paramecium pentaurelia TaxID=43138 RepID=A0A8S1U0A9_9CILI|nr:unnamed protein product [Paramecium pentaurelia]
MTDSSINQEVQVNRQVETIEDSQEFSQQLPNISIAMIQFQQQDDIQQNEIQNQQIINSNPNEDLQEKNQKLQEQNQKLYQQLSQTENQLNLINQRIDELNQEKNQNNTMINDLKKLVDQQRDFINQINNDQAYLDLTESLEITLQRLKEMEKKNEKLLEENLYYKTKYEESLIYIKSTKEETLNQQDRIDQMSQNYQQSSEDQLQKIQGLENEIRLLQQQISNK